MEKENTNGFKFYPGKHHGPFTSLNLINQSYPEAHYFSNSLKQIEEISGNEKPSTKTKIIEKKREKEKEEVKRYDRGGNCVASNTSKLFIKILNKRLSRFPVIEKYLNFYEIYSQKQNILLIPLCLYSFLKQYEYSYHNRFHSEFQIAQTRLASNLQERQRFNTRQIYIDIISELKDHIQCSLENSRAKYKDCSDSKKQFHLKNISIYNKISQIIKKVQQLANGLTPNNQQPQTTMQEEKTVTVMERVQGSLSSSSPQLSSDIKIQEEELQYSQIQESIEEKKESQQKSIKKSSGTYDLESLQSPLESLYQRKEREYQKAMDKVYSVIMNERPLRELFQIYKLNIEEILIESVNYCYRRNINSRVKKNEKIIKDIYQRLQNELLEALQLKDKENEKKLLQLRGWQFLIAFLTLQVAGDKKAEIYEEFKQNIRRKTKYFNMVQSTGSHDPKQQFDTYYYNYSLRILEEHYESQSKRKKQSQKDNLKHLHHKLKEWMIGYYYHNTLNRICFEEPRLTPKISITGKQNENKPQYQHLMTIPLLNTSSSILQRKKSEIIKEEEPEKVAVNTQQVRCNNFFGNKQEKALEKLMAEFQNLSKQNYENFY